MAKELFIERSFRPETLDVIEKANAILDEYERDGLVLTLRQVYYQFVARDLFPPDRRWSLDARTNRWKRDLDGTPNAEPNYEWLGDILSNARLAGLVDWSMLEDRMRSLEGVTHWSDPPEILDGVARQYREDVWASQRNRVEVWVEKDAVIGVIERACRELRVDYFACRGYASQSAYYAAGKRFRDYVRRGQRVVVLYMGDHDPSGIDMTRDVTDRLRLFSENDIEVRRVALNMDQIEQYDPPPNPVKQTDGRSAEYMRQFGETCWELDALEPRVLNQLVHDNVRPLISQLKKWKAAMDREAKNRNLLESTSRRWDEVRDYLTS